MLLTAILVIGGCASPQKPDYTRFQKSAELAQGEPSETPLNILFVSPGPVDVRGVYNPDDNIGGNGMLYAGDAGAGGMLAQVLIHAAISSSAQDKKLAEQQKQANKILEPIQDLITKIDTTMLEHESPHYRFVTTAPDDAVLVVRSQPIFFVSQDFTTFSVRNMVEVSTLAAPTKKQRGKKKKSTSYENLIEVIGAPVAKGSELELYRKDDGKELDAIFSDLYRISLELLIADFQDKYATGTPQVSFRFTQGEHSRFERGNVLQSDCNRTLIRNLRGWLISFNTPQDPQKSCVEPEAATHITTL
jgi:hypothetical protein